MEKESTDYVTVQTFSITLLGHIAHGSYNLGTNASAIECTHSILPYGNLPSARNKKSHKQKINAKNQTARIH